MCPIKRRVQRVGEGYEGGLGLVLHHGWAGIGVARTDQLADEQLCVVRQGFQCCLARGQPRGDDRIGIDDGFQPRVVLTQRDGLARLIAEAHAHVGQPTRGHLLLRHGEFLLRLVDRLARGRRKRADGDVGCLHRIIPPPPTALAACCRCW